MRKFLIIAIVFTFFWIVLSYSYYPKINGNAGVIIDPDPEKALINFSASEQGLDLKDGVAKGVYWSRRKPSEKPFFYSICYLHGFSAMRKELTPIVELIGDTIGAPVVFTRLEGHGYKDPANFTKASVAGWYRDAIECFEVASRIGQKVVVIGTSTGATLAALLAIHYKEPHQLVLLSPNFKIKNKFFPLLSGPFGPLVARLFFGKYREIPHIYNEDFKHYWTTKYSSSVLSVLADLLRNINLKDFQKIKAPVFMLTTPHDKVVSIEAVQKYALAKRSGKTVWENRSEIKNHNLAGDIVDPSQNKFIIEIISNFISQN